jgi:ferritin-like metal-binding protein YciE
MADTIDDQLVKYLTDAHSIEEQALAQMRTAPDIAGDAGISAEFAAHLDETEVHERLVRERLDRLGASPSAVKDVVMEAGGKAFLLFARSQPDTPGKLLAHAYSYEHLEEAAYRLLEHVASRAGDEATVELARRIGVEERRMAERLETHFDRAVAASLEGVAAAELPDRLVAYLTDAHAIEAQSQAVLERAPGALGEVALTGPFDHHLEETREHGRLLEERIAAHGATPSALKDAAMRLGGLNWSAFFQAQPDTPGKIVAFAYALEHLEIAAYEQLERVATRAGDTATAAVAKRILAEERHAAGEIAALFDPAADASLHEVGVGG